MRIAPIARGAALAAALLVPSIASGQDDFATEGDAWNSVSHMIRIARELGLHVSIPDRLDVGTLQQSDSLLILYPREALPVAELTAFLREGGRACLADDFGAGSGLLELFRISRMDPSPSVAQRLRDNPALLVARPGSPHRLSAGVDALVTNHPTVVRHRDLSPIFELSPGEAVVLAGAVGEGRLVVLSDPSVLIDNMLRLRGNRRFAENLLEYLDDGRGGRLLVVRPDTPVVGRYGEPGADRPLHDLRASLERMASVEPPPLALRVASLALAAITLVLGLGFLPRRSPYRASRMFAPAAAEGGLVGRVGFFARRGANLAQPLLVYKFELEAELLERLSLDEQTPLRDVLAAMRRRGMGEEDVNDMRALLLALDRLHERQDRPEGPPRVRAARFRELVARGERLLEKLA